MVASLDRQRNGKRLASVMRPAPGHVLAGHPAGRLAVWTHRPRVSARQPRRSLSCALFLPHLCWLRPRRHTEEQQRQRAKPRHAHRRRVSPPQRGQTSPNSAPRSRPPYQARRGAVHLQQSMRQAAHDWRGASARCLVGWPSAWRRPVAKSSR